MLGQGNHARSPLAYGVCSGKGSPVRSAFQYAGSRRFYLSVIQNIFNNEVVAYHLSNESGQPSMAGPFVYR
ncbi:hypothetical protein UF75_4251 [Desulfosporosinus sp. I2]|nr:hypothetical protein UF75_4251 [Desulfosporosinus sp. I2]